MHLFRRARPAQTSWNAAKTLLQIVCFWGFFLGVLPPRLVAATQGMGSRPLFAPSPRIAVVLFVAASFMGLWSAWTMVVMGRGTPLPLDAPRDLVVSGPYRHVRNPMAVAGVGQGVAVSLWYGSWVVFAFFVVGGLVWHVVVRPIEERDLVNQFGDAYARYRASTGLWLPCRRT